MQHQLLVAGPISGTPTADPPLQVLGVGRGIPGGRDGEQQEGEDAPERREHGQQDAEVADLVGHEAGQGRRENEQDWDDCIDHGHLLDGQA